MYLYPEFNRYKLYHPFPVPFFIIDFDKNDYELISNQIENCISDLESKKRFNQQGQGYDADFFEKQVVNFPFSNAPSDGSNIINEYDLSHLTDKILEYLKKYYYLIHKKHAEDEKIDILITGSWLSKSNSQDYLPVHHHHNLDVSGVYYHKIPEGSGSLHFRSNDKLSEISLFYSRSQNYIVNPKNGKLVLFPSWIDHYVSGNTTSEDRIAFGFTTKCSKLN